MLKQLLLPTFIFIAHSVSAQLAPQEPASLIAHMTEVNAEWGIHQHALPEGNSSVSFANEQERIAMHLNLVRHYLNEHGMEGLSADQTERRSYLLEQLNAYTGRGNFPQNQVLPFRNPIFIDPYGTACAVGQMMIESGAADLAEFIDSKMETYYVRDMEVPALNVWADMNGFAAEELAWIQPGYPPSTIWTSMNGGTDGNVTVIKELTNDSLLVAGSFTNAGGVDVMNVALWTGAVFVPMGAIPNGDITSAVEFNGNIYVGGSFSGGSSALMRWDGSSWNSETVFSSKFAQVYALHVHNGELYAAGSASGFAGIDDAVVRWNGSAWDLVGEVFNAPIYALASHNGQLVAGGAFDGLDGPTDPVVQHVATFSGTSWSQIGDGLDATVRALLTVDGTLYAGGDLYANVVPVFGLARVEPGQTQWEMLLPGKSEYMYANVGLATVNALTYANGKVYLGGDFFYQEGDVGLISMNLIGFNGTPDDCEAMIGMLNGPIRSISPMNTRLVIGGDFTTPFEHIAMTDLNTGIQDQFKIIALTTSPNPTTNEVTIQLPSGVSDITTVNCTDMNGKYVPLVLQRNSNSLTIDVRTLANGAYTILLSDGFTNYSTRFVKQ